ncbi:MAG: cyclase family protein [bacterium]
MSDAKAAVRADFEIYEKIPQLVGQLESVRVKREKCARINCVQRLLVCAVLLLSGCSLLDNKKEKIGAGMPYRNVIDLTHVFSKDMPVHSYDDSVKIEKIRTLDANYYNDSRLTSGMHVGTHIDGPGHLSDSKVLMSEMPVEKFVGKGCLIDARGKMLDASLLDQVSEQENLIVLILTGYSKKFGTQEYFTDYPEILPDLAQALVKRKIKMLGIDMFSPDNYPFQVHKLMLENNILIIENLTNIEKLVGIKDFTVVALPLKLETDSALARVIALV